MRSFSPAQMRTDGRNMWNDIWGMIRRCTIILPLLHGFHLIEGWGQFSTKQVTNMIHKLDSSRLVDSASRLV